MRRKNVEDFIIQANKTHNAKYDYSKTNYVNSNTPIVIICPEHGEFLMRPQNHLQGQGCPKCSRNKMGAYQKSNTKEFIEKSQKIHGDKYDYSKVEYANNRVKVTITCPIHGDFKQKPLDHLHGSGCPECGRKFGVAEKQVLETLKIHYGNVIYQYIPKWLHNKTSPQSLDMFLPNYNIAIEYQGRQHFKPNKRFGNEEEFTKVQRRDVRKFELCKKNGVKLFYISFEKQIPNDYFAPIYKTTDELISAINTYIKEQESNPKTIVVTENMLKQVISNLIN